MSLSSDLPFWIGWVFQRRLSVSYTKSKDQDARGLEERYEKVTWRSALGMQCSFRSLSSLAFASTLTASAIPDQRPLLRLSTEAACSPLGWKEDRGGWNFLNSFPATLLTSASPFLLTSAAHTLKLSPFLPFIRETLYLHLQSLLNLFSFFLPSFCFITRIK